METRRCSREKMEGVMKEEDFLTYNNTKQHIYIFDEVENPKGIVQIIHGMQESMKTYFDFVKFLNQHGYAVVGLDLRAHGKTAGDLSQIGVCRETLFKNIVQDQIFLSKMIKSKSSLPLYVFGHSYGSFILQRYIQLYSGYEKVILCGSSYMKKPLIRFGKFMAGLFCAFGGAHKKAHLIENMSFNSYQKKFKTGSWITSDEEEAKKFYDDEMNALPFENAFYKDMFSNQLKLYSVKELAKIDTHKPIFIISGEDDPIGDYSKSVKKLYDLYYDLGLNVQMKLYAGLRHGLVQETKKDEVMQDVLRFIEE